MQNTTYRGSAINDGVALTTPLHIGDLIAQINDAPGWPNGADHRLFVAQIDGGTDSEERVLCSQLSGSGPVTVTLVERGYDGTVEAEHNTGATFEHDLDAIVIDQLVLHVLDESRDDHQQYLNTDRHDTPTRHVFGDALALPAAPAPIGTAAAVGAGDAPAREDHVHVIGPGAINDPAMLGPDVIISTAIAAGAVINSDIGANSVSPSELQLGVAVTALAASNVSPAAADATHIAMPPDPTVVTFWRQPDKKRLYVADSTAWRWLDGSPLKCLLSYHVDGNNIANGFGFHPLNEFTADANEFAMASAGGTITIPANVVGPPAYAFDGEWDLIWSLLLSNEGATSGAPIQLNAVTNTLTYVLENKENTSSHSTLLEGRKTVPFAALATVHLELAHDGPSTAKILTGSTFEARYRGVA